jgi:transcriptional regulator with XRE-family HTH domain
MPAMTADEDIGRRIKHLRTQVLRIQSQREFAKRLGDLTRGAVGNWEVGKGIKQANLQRIADEFGASYEWLATGRGEARITGALTTSLNRSEKLGSVPIKGVVEAGNWQDIDRWGSDDMDEHVPSSSDYPLDWQYAFVVRGESLNRIAKNGDRLVCLDLIKSMVSIADGDLVICERSRYGGQMVERTAKRVRRTIRGYELWPESDDGDHQVPIEWKPEGESDSNSVHVVAKVLWVLRKP